MVALLLTTPVDVLFGEDTVVFAMTGVWTPINNAIVQRLKYFL